MTTDLVAAPDWHLLVTDPLERQSAEAHHATIVAELQLAGRWTPANAHAVLRLVLAYLLYDRSACDVIDRGVQVPSPKTGVPQYNLHFTAMTQAATTAAQLETELMISPRKRGKTPMRVAKVAGGAGPKAL